MDSAGGPAVTPYDNAGAPAAGSGASGGGAGTGGGPSVILIPQPGVPGSDPNAPTCGASSYAAEQIIVETEVEVPVEITEEIPEEVTETVTELVTTEVEVTKPVVLYIQLDRSGSMDLNGLWSPAVKAVKSFVNSEKSAGLGVALQYFPLQPKVSKECSTGAGYVTPAVPISMLPEQVGKITKSLDATSPVDLLQATTYGTPMEGALRGATEFCKTYQAQHSDEQCVAVIVTDGKPEYRSDCETNNDNLAKIAANALTAGVKTFAVGLNGSDFGLLDKIAKAGGAPKCDAKSSKYACDVSKDANKLADALATIRETVLVTETRTETHEVTHVVTRTVTRTEVRTEIVKEIQSAPLPCEWAVPQTDQAFDRNKVNVRLSSGEEGTTFVRVESQDKCRADAWYFDNADNPSRLIACPDACTRIEGTDNANIDILLGCATLVPELL